MQSVRKFKMSLEPFALVPYHFGDITLTKPEAICSIYLDINQVFLFFSEIKYIILGMVGQLLRLKWLFSYTKVSVVSK